MKPLDPRLLRYARSARVFLVIGALLGLIQTAAIVGAAWSIAYCVTESINGQPFTQTSWALAVLVVSVLVRGLAQWGMEWAGARAAASAKSELRDALMRTVAKESRTGTASSTDLTLLATHHLDALDSYFGKYLPQLLLTAIAMPLLIVVTLYFDIVSGITEVIVLPIIPMFMALIGWATRRAQAKQLDSLRTLASSFLEIIEGLSTLKIFGRARRQRDRILQITDDYRATTMKVLRVSFLSGFALELFASLSVALVAVQIGIRLIDNDMTLFAGLVALILAPEVFAPLRAVGAQFHAASAGVQAAEDVFAVLEATPARTTVKVRSTHGDQLRLEIEDLSVSYDDHEVLHAVTEHFCGGEVTALSGESGAGKSTLFASIRGTVPASGNITLQSNTSKALDDQIAWMGQASGLIAGTVAENVALGMPNASREQIEAAMRMAGVAEVDPDAVLGVGGAGLSGGQAQRVAFARCVLRAELNDCAVVLLDEPTSALDREREQVMIAGMRELARQGRVVIVISHRRPVLEAADRVVPLPLLPQRPATSEVTV
nr:thiol reductant ABC exporter subunit CydD [Pseudoclavibacter sp. Marseille-Q3772]